VLPVLLDEPVAPVDPVEPVAPTDPVDPDAPVVSVPVALLPVLLLGELEEAPVELVDVLPDTVPVPEPETLPEPETVPCAAPPVPVDVSLPLMFVLVPAVVPLFVALPVTVPAVEAPRLMFTSTPPALVVPLIAGPAEEIVTSRVKEDSGA